MRNNGCVKPFWQGHLDLDKEWVFYYYTPRTATVREIRLRVFPFKFIRVLIPECHISPLSGHSHDQRKLFRKMEWFLWTIVNKEVDQFIIFWSHFQFEDLFSNEALQMLQRIESYTPFDMVFLYFWGPGEIYMFQKNPSLTS